MIYFVLVISGLIIDFITKKLAVIYLKSGTEKIIIDGIFKLSYVENKGAAFGILKNQRYVFIILTILIIAFILFWIIKNKPTSKMLKIGAALLISGALGNLIDRVMLGYVVDFLDFYLINFPVFNFADCFVCIGAGLVAIYYLFFEEGDTNGRV